MAKTGLGRGPEHCWADKTAYSRSSREPAGRAETVPANAVREVSIDSVQPCPSQPRKHFERQLLEELAASIEVNGILQLLVARTTGEGQLADRRECRWRVPRLPAWNRAGHCSEASDYRCSNWPWWKPSADSTRWKNPRVRAVNGGFDLTQEATPSVSAKAGGVANVGLNCRNCNPFAPRPIERGTP